MAQSQNMFRSKEHKLATKSNFKISYFLAYLQICENSITMFFKFPWFYPIHTSPRSEQPIPSSTPAQTLSEEY